MSWRIYATCVPGLVFLPWCVVTLAYPTYMTSLEQLRNDHSELRDCTDEELLALQRDLITAARLIVGLWVQEQTGSNHVPFGLLPRSDGAGYDGDDVLSV